MGRLNKQQTKLYDEARELVYLQRSLTSDEKEFVLENWDPAATTNLTANSAFFTPRELASHLAIETYDCDSVVLDLCAGIGVLGYEYLKRNPSKQTQLICIEREHRFIEIGRRILPEATWIHCDVFDLLQEDFFKSNKVKFKHAEVEFISNPPFGTIPKNNRGKCVGNKFEYAVAEIGMTFATTGTMIVSQGILPWEYSGRPGYKDVPNDEYSKWSSESGLVLRPNCGIDTTMCGEFKHTKIKTEITNVYRDGEE